MTDHIACKTAAGFLSFSILNCEPLAVTLASGRFLAKRGLIAASWAAGMAMGLGVPTEHAVAGEPIGHGVRHGNPGGAHHHPGGIGSGVTKHAATKHDWLAGTYFDPAIQRPDFFPHAISKSIPEYRQEYNRPRYWTGWIAYKVEPSSQESMAWQTNYCNGNYQNRSGAFVPTYYYPKPWESLNTQPRPGKQ
jgi:hypothetical protein